MRKPLPCYCLTHACLLDIVSQEADAAPADAGPLLVTVTLKAFKDDKKVGVIKEIKRIMAETDPKFNLAAVRIHSNYIHTNRSMLCLWELQNLVMVLQWLIRKHHSFHRVTTSLHVFCLA